MVILKNKAPDPKYVSANHIYKKCVKAFGSPKHWKPFFADPQYITCYKKDLVAFLKKDLLNKEKYRTTIFDCDDFAAILVGEIKKWRPGQCFGEIWLNEHAQNIWYCQEEDCLYLIEPQSDTMTKTKKAPHPVIMVKM